MAPGLDALLQRPRPGAWQLFLRQPCVYLARLLFSWRRPVVPPSSSQPTGTIDASSDADSPVSVVCISDTHNSQPSLPDGDVLIHAGDLTESGTLAELEAAVAWLRRLPHSVKIVVAGNHDTLLDASFSTRTANGAQPPLPPRLDWGDIVYLDNEEATITCPTKDGRRPRQLRVFGSPLSPRYGNWAFQYPRSHDHDPWSRKNIIPSGGVIDILITHSPPHAHLDEQYGCVHLLRALWRVRPRLHVFGHVHEGRGTEWVQFDALQAAYEKTVIEKGGILNLSRVMVCFLREYIFGRRSTIDADKTPKCLLVNAAMVGGLRDDDRRQPVRVLL